MPPETNASGIERPVSDQAARDVISPELALIDPELARSARERLPLPGTTYRPRWVPRHPTPRTPAVAPAAAVELPKPAPPPAPVRVAPRLLAVAALIPISIALALAADFHESGGQPFDEGAPTERQTSTRSEPTRTRAARPARSRTTRRAHGGSSGRAAARRPAHRRAPRWSRVQAIEGVVAEIGSRPRTLTRALGRPTVRARNGQYCHVSWRGRGLTIVLVAGRARNPCTNGRAVGGFATAGTWRTRRGLRVGTSLGQLRRRYPHARSVGSGWWKLDYVRVARSKARIPLHAHVARGHVDKILVN
jgi:hypothetical protein